MPKPFKLQNARPLPPGAEVVTHEGRPHVRVKERGRAVLFPLSKDGTKYLKPSKRWYFELRDATGIVRRVKGYADLKATEQLAAESERKASRVRSGHTDPGEDHARRPLADHLTDYGTYLESKGNVPAHNRATVAKVSAILDGCGFVFPPDLDAGKVSAWLANLRRPGRLVEIPVGEAFSSSAVARMLGVSVDAVRRYVARHRLQTVGAGRGRKLPRATVQAVAEQTTKGAGPTTANRYTVAVRGFTRWLVKAKRIGSDPLDALPLVSTAVDVRRARRELTADELLALLTGTRASGRTYRGLAGADRYFLYLTAAGTGFRANALANLTPADFDLTAPVVTLPARFNKSRKTKVQPLPTDVATELRGYLDGKPTGTPVWGGSWRDTGAEMLRADLEAVGIPYAVEGPDGPEYADFHALRHTYLTLLGRHGVDLRTAQELAGHSTPLLTARYSHRRLHDLAGAVDKLPNLVPPPAGPTAGEIPLRLTGTDAGRKATAAVVPAVVTGRAEVHQSASFGNREPVGANADTSRNPLEITGAGAGLRRPAPRRTELPGLDSNQDKENQNRANCAFRRPHFFKHFVAFPLFSSYFRAVPTTAGLGPVGVG
ncbi:MAG: tyrosine-type recombinase/integrase [Gemmataceae bacterium]